MAVGSNTPIIGTLIYKFQQVRVARPPPSILKPRKTKQTISDEYNAYRQIWFLNRKKYNEISEKAYAF